VHAQRNCALVRASSRRREPVCVIARRAAGWEPRTHGAHNIREESTSHAASATPDARRHPAFIGAPGSSAPHDIRQNRPMRPFGFILRGKHLNLSRPRLYAPLPVNRRRWPRRRMEDQIETLFNRACLLGNLDAAADLLALLEKWYSLGSARIGRERRINGDAMHRARRELERLTAQSRT
jgi:hypothetical protein